MKNEKNCSKILGFITILLLVLLIYFFREALLIISEGLSSKNGHKSILYFNQGMIFLLIVAVSMRVNICMIKFCIEEDRTGWFFNNKIAKIASFDTEEYFKKMFSENQYKDYDDIIFDKSFYQKNLNSSIINSATSTTELLSYKELTNIQKLEKALEKAHDIRKFEIELLWKRSTYFWAFIAFVFIAYGVTVTTIVANYSKINSFISEIVLNSHNMQSESNISHSISWSASIENTNTTTKQNFSITNNEKNEQFALLKKSKDFIFYILTFINMIGVIATFIWTEVIRGSKAWYESWEKHIDMLEFHVTGNLHKIVHNGNEKFIPSPSRLSTFSALIVCLIWFSMQIALIGLFYKKNIESYLLFYFIALLGFYIVIAVMTLSSRANKNILKSLFIRAMSFIIICYRMISCLSFFVITLYFLFCILLGFGFGEL